MTDTPDLTTYRAVHSGLRRAAHDLAESIIAMDPHDRRRTASVARWWRGYAGEVEMHHTVEDTHFFPALVDRVPSTIDLLARTDGDHAHLDELLVSVGRALEALRRGPDPAACRDRALPLVVELARHMDEHLDFEDQEILPLFETHFSAEEYAAMDGAAVKSLGLSRQLAFSVPFIVGAIPHEDLPRMLAEAPLPMRVTYRLTRRSHARLTSAAFGRPAGSAAGAPVSTR